MWRNSGGKQDLKPAVDGLPQRFSCKRDVRLEGGQKMARLTDLGMTGREGVPGRGTGPQDVMEPLILD